MWKLWPLWNHRIDKQCLYITYLQEPVTRLLVYLHLVYIFDNTRIHWLGSDLFRTFTSSGKGFCRWLFWCFLCDRSRVASISVLLNPSFHWFHFVQKHGSHLVRDKNWYYNVKYSLSSKCSVANVPVWYLNATICALWIQILITPISTMGTLDHLYQYALAQPKLSHDMNK